MGKGCIYYNIRETLECRCEKQATRLVVYVTRRTFEYSQLKEKRNSGIYKHLHADDFKTRNQRAAISIKNAIFWDIIPCSPLKDNWSFGGTCHLTLQGRWIRRARSQRETRGRQFSSWYIARIIIRPWDGICMFLRKIGWLSTYHIEIDPRGQYCSQPLLWEAQFAHARSSQGKLYPQVIQSFNLN
jgi:hypothetical protein